MKEQCMICIDNSEWMRNGDYAPTRLDAQLEAANLICGSKTQSNPETTIGVLTMGDSNPSVKVAPTTDLGKLLSSLSSVNVGGGTHFSKALQIAYLVLKNRAPEQGTPNRRLVIFVGSPIEESKDDLVKLGLRMKKNSVACDVINFGEVHENTAKLEAFISSVNRDDNSRLETIPPGPHILSDMLLSSPIVGMGGGGASASPSGTGGAATGGEGGGDFEFGVDPSLDPELAMAIRLSLEEEKRRQEREKQTPSSTGTSSSTEQQPAAGESSSTTESTSALPTSSEQQPQNEDDDIDMEDDEALEKALLLSKQEAGMVDEEEDEMDEDAALEAALKMSMEESKNNDENIDDIVEDQEFMQDLVGGLGKNVNSDEVLKKDKKDEEKK